MQNNILLFFQTLTNEVLIPSDYVDWNNIKEQIKELRREIALIQSLDKENAKEDLTDIINKNPLVLKVLKLLIAHTPDKIYFDIQDKYIDFIEDIKNVSQNKKRAEEIASIFIDIGLVDFLKEVKSVEDVIKGVLIGLQPNVRKNKRGQKSEIIIGNLISNLIDEINKEKKLNLLLKKQMFIDLKKERKKIDYVVMLNLRPIIGIETNFYSTSGSKPSETLGRAYPELQQSLKEKNIDFIVITDGPGWNSMKPVIENAYKKLSYLMNIKQAIKGKFKQAVYDILKNHQI